MDPSVFRTHSEHRLGSLNALSLSLSVGVCGARGSPSPKCSPGCRSLKGTCPSELRRTIRIMECARGRNLHLINAGWPWRAGRPQSIETARSACVHKAKLCSACVPIPLLFKYTTYNSLCSQRNVWNMDLSCSALLWPALILSRCWSVGFVDSAPRMKLCVYIFEPVELLFLFY